MSQTFNSVFHAQKKTIAGSVGEIDSISSLLDQVGMSKLAKRLELIATNLEEASKAASDAYYDKIAEDSKVASANTNNLLTALVAGVELGRNDG